jgi:hypothetical protein
MNAAEPGGPGYGKAIRLAQMVYLLLADASEFIHRQLKRFEPALTASFRARWPYYNIGKVTVVPRFNYQDMRDAIALGGTFRFFLVE